MLQEHQVRIFTSLQKMITPSVKRLMVLPGLQPPVTGMGFMWMETEPMMALQILIIALLSTEEEAVVTKET